ncbi:hypothetical protein [Polycladospora coralii]|uniref:hypothetical protein n=1 Tax=Polycladospora coralii TaxID=2771432 RepID=UPI001747123C|nr:hypothetical protein [Polycladospora coralii]
MQRKIGQVGFGVVSSLFCCFIFLMIIGEESSTSTDTKANTSEQQIEQETVITHSTSGEALVLTKEEMRHAKYNANSRLQYEEAYLTKEYQSDGKVIDITFFGNYDKMIANDRVSLDSVIQDKASFNNWWFGSKDGKTLTDDAHLYTKFFSVLIDTYSYSPEAEEISLHIENQYIHYSLTVSRQEMEQFFNVNFSDYLFFYMKGKRAQDVSIVNNSSAHTQMVKNISEEKTRQFFDQNGKLTHK